MPFEFIKTELEGLQIIIPHMFSDGRGLYKKYYEKDIFAEHGITCEFNESSDLYSKKGALRGLHYQAVNSQAKLIHIISGTLFDVALDLRENSPTYGKFHTELMTAEDRKIIFIPEGFAHGFISLTENTVFSYQCSGKYTPEACGGILWCDPGLNIPYPLKEYGIDSVIVTEKDAGWGTLEEYTEKMRGK